VKAAVLVATLFVAGCDVPPPPQSSVDQCLRRETFERCLSLVPKAPQVSKYNDWAEVVDECDDFAANSSYRHPSVITQACRSGW
jgi:hypothetical protein